MTVGPLHPKRPVSWKAAITLAPSVVVVVVVAAAIAMASQPIRDAYQLAYINEGTSAFLCR